MSARLVASRSMLGNLGQMRRGYGAKCVNMRDENLDGVEHVNVEEGIAF